MAEQVEVSSLDLRYEDFRMRSLGAEKVLLVSILEKGIRNPLQGVDTKGARILLDGFKRLRCAKKLGMSMAPYASMGADEVLGIIELIRISNARSLSILEQARFVDELKSVHKMSTAEIAGLLERSKAWVSVRSGIIHEMSDYVLDQIFKGRFPVYAYMYTLRPFIRINGVQTNEVNEFVRSVSGKNLSIRAIGLLANGYFRGPEALREQIKNGHITWALGRLKESRTTPSGCSQMESAMIRDLEIVSKYMQRVTTKTKHPKYKTNAFFAQANLLTGGILRQTDSFLKAIRTFHDRTGQA
ncbi:MAG: chromosome partitioning protein ParB [Thermodesulfobacteriota bacterium]|nr:chromosome partitioning protein ParB [Thermodesulfobacteriota bacterium]